MNNDNNYLVWHYVCKCLAREYNILLYYCIINTINVSTTNTLMYTNDRVHLLSITVSFEF